jgi:hypothetical protein
MRRIGVSLIGIGLVLLVRLGVFSLFHYHIVLLLFTVERRARLVLVLLRGLVLNEWRYRLDWVLTSPVLLFVDDRHCFDIGDIGAFDDEDCASNFDNVTNFQRMQAALFPFRTQSKPCAISRPDISQFEYFSYIVVSYFSVEIAHL